MGEELRLEPIAMDEGEKIKDIMVQVVEDEAIRWFKNGDRPYMPGFNSIDMQKYHTWDNKYYKIIYHEDIIGVTLISYTGREHGRIDRLYILPKYQDMGLGSNILKVIEELFPKVNIWSLDTIEESSRNHHFYEKNGYKLIGKDTGERYYRKITKNDIGELENYWIGKDLINNNFRQCNLKNSDFYDSNMSNSKFSNMNLCKNTYANSNLSNSRFTNTNMSSSIFGDSNMAKVEICHVSISNAYIHDINLDIDKIDSSITMERCELSNSKIIDSNLENLSLENCNIKGMSINGINVEELIEIYKNYKVKE